MSTVVDLVNARVGASRMLDAFAEFTHSDTSDVAGSTYTYSPVSLGEEDPSRDVVAFVVGNRASSTAETISCEATLNSSLFGSSTMLTVSGADTQDSANFIFVFRLPVPVGEDCSISLTFSDEVNRTAIGVFTVKNRYQVEAWDSSQSQVSQTTTELETSVADGGCIIAASLSAIGGVNGMKSSYGLRNFPTAIINHPYSHTRRGLSTDNEWLGIDHQSTDVINNTTNFTARHFVAGVAFR